MSTPLDSGMKVAKLDGDNLDKSRAECFIRFPVRPLRPEKYNVLAKTRRSSSYTCGS